jgi:hypothetical protein
MPVNIPAPSSTFYTDMSVLEADIRDIMLDPVATPGADGNRITKAALLRAFNRAVKTAIERNNGYKAWVDIDIVSGTQEYPISDTATVTATVLQVYEAVLDGRPITPITYAELDQELYLNSNSINTVTGIARYALKNTPPTIIKLDGTPDENITAGLKLYALQYPASVTDISGQTSVLPTYYDNYLIDRTCMLLFSAYQDEEQTKKYVMLSDMDLNNILRIESPVVDGRITPAFT